MLNPVFLIIIGLLALIGNYYMNHKPKLVLEPEIDIIDREIWREVRLRRSKIL